MTRVRMRPSIPRGITLIELMIAALLSVLIFGVIYMVLSRARAETQKGYWIQQAIQDLRNSSRRLSYLLKRTSYPTTIEKSGTEEVVISYKEWREYDDSGRLRGMVIKSDDKEMDMYLLPGSTSPDPEPQRLMLFPICTPEKVGEEGTITWVEVILEASPIYSATTPVGQIRLVTREEKYNSRGLKKRAYDLKKKFSEEIPIKSDQIIVRDVNTVDIQYYSADEVVGISVAAAKNSAAIEHKRKRYIIAVKTECVFPKDDKVMLPDQFTVVNNIDVSEFAGGITLEVLAILGGENPSGAKITLNGVKMDVSLGATLPGNLKVVSITKSGIKVQVLPGNRIRSYGLKEKPG